LVKSPLNLSFLLATNIKLTNSGTK
jgi:hypothetical protein